MSQPFPSVRPTAIITGAPETKVAGIASSIMFLSNPNRIQFSIVFPETSTGILYITYGSLSSATLFTYYLNPGDILVSTLGEWFGPIAVICTVAAQDVYVTELE